MVAEQTEPPVLRPRDAEDLGEILRGHPRAVEPLGRGSKRSVGPPVEADPLALTALAGIVAYEAAELVLTAGAATPLETVNAALEREGQRLGFEPADFGPLLGVEAGQTLGGVLTANLAGSRRLTAGGARDHFLGFQAVTGDGLRFKGGGRVVKNVTGYDLPKVLAGSWGTLAVLTEVTLRVVPRPETEVTLILPADGPETAVGLLTAALSSPHDVRPPPSIRPAVPRCAWKASRCPWLRAWRACSSCSAGPTPSASTRIGRGGSGARWAVPRRSRPGPLSGESRCRPRPPPASSRRSRPSGICSTGPAD